MPYPLRYSKAISERTNERTSLLALAIPNNKFARYVVENKNVSISLSASLLTHLVAPAFVDQMLVITVDASDARYAESVKPADHDNSTADQQAFVEPTPPVEIIEPKPEQSVLAPDSPEVLPEPLPNPIPEPSPEPLSASEPSVFEKPDPQPILDDSVLAEITPRDITAPQPLNQATPIFDASPGITEVQSLTALESTFEVVSAKATQIPEAKTEVVSIPEVQKVMLKEKALHWITNTIQPSQQPQQTRWEIDGQEFEATFTAAPSENDMSLETATIEINTMVDGEQRTTKMQLNRLAFSNFGQFINRSERDTQIHNDEFDGRFHSNTRMTLAYSKKVKPKFHGKVTTSASGVTLYNSNNRKSRNRAVRNEIFQGGFESNIKKIPLPKTFIPFPEDSAVTEQQVHRFAKDTAIIFHRDGRYSWRTAGGETEQSSIGEKSLYLIGENKAKITLNGEVRGKALVYSPERIVIMGNLTYAGAADGSNQRDYLGLVSDRYIDIAAPSITGGGDLSIHAAIYAGKRFTVKRYTHRKESLLTIFGSLTVGSMSPTEPRFRTLIKFDERLENLRPPGFPMTERYELDTWEANWNNTVGSETPATQSAP